MLTVCMYKNALKCSEESCTLLGQLLEALLCYPFIAEPVSEVTRRWSELKLLILIRPTNQKTVL